MSLSPFVSVPTTDESQICRGGCTMASGQTSNYGLNQWAAEDKVLREEFNRDNAKLDSKLGQIPNIVTGTYQVPQEQLGQPYHISLGFRPKLVLVWRNQVSGYAVYLLYCAMALDGSPITEHTSKISLMEIDDDGFFVQRVMYNSSTAYYPQLSEATEYMYMAIG